jgi:prophage antirepressor-like protein
MEHNKNLICGQYTGHQQQEHCETITKDIEGPAILAEDLPSVGEVSTVVWGDYSIRYTVDAHETPWFVVKDIAECLGMSNQGHIPEILSRFPWSEGGTVKLETETKAGISQKYDYQTICSNAFIALCFRSNSEHAIKFTTWVCSKVIPSIMRTGEYRVPVDNNLEHYKEQVCDHISQELNKTRQLIREDSAELMFASSYPENADALPDDESPSKPKKAAKKAVVVQPWSSEQYRTISELQSQLVGLLGSWQKTSILINAEADLQFGESFTLDKDSPLASLLGKGCSTMYPWQILAKAHEAAPETYPHTLDDYIKLLSDKISPPGSSISLWGSDVSKEAINWYNNTLLTALNAFLICSGQTSKSLTLYEIGKEYSDKSKLPGQTVVQTLLTTVFLSSKPAANGDVLDGRVEFESLTASYLEWSKRLTECGYFRNKEQAKMFQHCFENNFLFSKKDNEIWTAI